MIRRKKAPGACKAARPTTYREKEKKAKNSIRITAPCRACRELEVWPEQLDRGLPFPSREKEGDLVLLGGSSSESGKKTLSTVPGCYNGTCLF